MTDKDNEVDNQVTIINASDENTNEKTNPFSGATLNINVNTNNTTSSENSENKISPKKRNIPKLISIFTSLAITSTLVGFALYSLISLPIKETTRVKETYLNIKNYSYTQTVRALEEFDKSNSNKIKDYSIVGSKLFVGECKLTPDVFLSPNTVFGLDNVGISLYEIKSDIYTSIKTRTDLENGKYYIDFSIVDPGSYLIYPYKAESSPNMQKKDIAPYSIKSDTSIDLSFYTLPSVSDGTRKKVNIRNNYLSPFTLIDVVDVGSSLPAGYYDAVLYPSIYSDDEGIKDGISESSEVSLDLLSDINSLTNAINDLKTSNGINNVYKVVQAKSLVEANSIIANTALAINDKISNNYTSIYLKADTYESFSVRVLESDTTLPKYDYYPEIRELIGYLDNSGNAYGGIKYNDIVSKSNSPIGKESVIVSNKEGLENDAYGTIIKALRR